MEQHSTAVPASLEKVVPVLLRSAEMHWRGQLRENSIQKLPEPVCAGPRNATRIRLNDSHLK